LETTGLSVSSDRIVELAILKIHPDGTEDFRSVRINPEIPIPTAATNIHGITNEECQLDMHPELPRDVARLHDFCNPEETDWIDTEGKIIWSEGEAIVSVGQYKGKSLKEIRSIDSEYLRWMGSADFSAEVKDIAAKALNGEFPKP